MSGPDLDKVTKELFDAARGETPRAEKKDAILEEVLRNGGPAGGGATALSRWMKWAGFSVLLLLGALFAFSSVQRDVEVIPPQLPSVATVTPIEPPPTPPAQPSIEPPVAPPETETAVEPPPSPPPSVASSQTEERDLLAEEVRLVDEARSKVSEQPSEALKVLERHRRRFPRGSLKVEADLVRVEALLRSGKRAEADSVSRRLISANPNGPVAARAQRLMESLP